MKLLTDETSVGRAKTKLVKVLDFFENWRFHLARCIKMDADNLNKRARRKLINFYKKLHDLSYRMESISEQFDCPFFDEILEGRYSCNTNDCNKCPYFLGCSFHLCIGLLIGQLTRSLAAIRSEFAV